MKTDALNYIRAEARSKKFVFIFSFLCAFLLSLDVVQFYDVRIGFFFVAFLFIVLGSFYGFLVNKSLFFLIFIFFGFSILSVYEADDALRAFSYILYFVFSVLVSAVFFRLSVLDSSQSFSGVMWSLRLVVLLTAFQSFVLGSERASAGFYEPSYLAFAFVLYFSALSVYWSKLPVIKKVLETLLVFLLLYTTGSLFVFFAFLLSILMVALLKTRTGALLRLVMFVTILISIFFFLKGIFFDFFGDHILFARLGRLFDASNFFYVLESLAGNRFPRIYLAMDVIGDNWFLGIGPGNYLHYLNASSDRFDAYLHLPEWRSPYGRPEVNGFLGIWLNYGLFPLIVFFGFLTIVVRNLYRSLSFLPESLVFLSALLAFLCLIQFETSFLRPYFWIIIGLSLGANRTYKYRSRS